MKRFCVAHNVLKSMFNKRVPRGTGISAKLFFAPEGLWKVYWKRWTSNIERPTSNVEWQKSWRSKRIILKKGCLRNPIFHPAKDGGFDIPLIHCSPADRQDERSELSSISVTSIKTAEKKPRLGVVECSVLYVWFFHSMLDVRCSTCPQCLWVVLVECPRVSARWQWSYHHRLWCMAGGCWTFIFQNNPVWHKCYLWMFTR